MVEDLVQKIGEERLRQFKEKGFLYTLNTKANPPYVSLKHIDKEKEQDIEIRVHNHLAHKGDEKHLISVSQTNPFERIAFKGIMYETRQQKDSKSGRYIISGLCDLSTILINLDQIIERYHKNQYC